MEKKVLIIMGSKSDLQVMKRAAETLERFGIDYEMTVASAHRSPERTRKIVSGVQKKGVQAIIAGAGGAAHLAGVIAAETIIPVIGVPLDSSPLKGIDSLLSTVQMPAGIPVATMAVGEAGARNAGVFAAQIIALNDEAVRDRLIQYRKDLAKGVKKKAEEL